jgi:hypothetical protein
MSDIKRFEANSLWSVFGDPNGSYVDYDDHAAIVAQLESQLAEAKKDQARYLIAISDRSSVLELSELVHLYGSEKSEIDEVMDQLVDAAIASIQESK